jgi:hypothetical protein
MKSEIWLDLCFIREAGGDAALIVEVERLLGALFPDRRLTWELEAKREGALEVVNAAVKGYSEWEQEQEVLLYIERQASPEFWQWMQAYRLELDLKRPAECRHCEEQKSGAGA